MKQEELQKTLKKHSLWIKGEAGGIKADLSGAKLSEVNLSRANLAEVNLSGATLSEANLFGANLFRADLSRADLSGANLSGAKLSRADLSGADLSGANLSGTIYENKTKTELTYQKHIASYFGLDEIRIGCKVYSISYWLANFEAIGKEADYTPEQIKKYGEFIKACAADYKRSKK